MKTHFKILATLLLFTTAQRISSQEINPQDKVLSMEQVFDLAAKNSEQLKIASKGTELAHQKIEIVKLGQLPALNTGINYGYVSNSEIWDPSFKNHQTAPIPHNLTQVSLQASEVLFKGGEIKNNIQRARLEEQTSALTLEKSIVDVKFAAAAKYLEIYRAINQKQVYLNNLALAQERLKNIIAMQKQGMITNNDVLRNKLIVSDLELAIRKTDNSIEILNRQLNILTGMDEHFMLQPDTSLLQKSYSDDSIDILLRETYSSNQELKIAHTENDIAQTNIKLSATDKYPELSIFAASNFQRPYVNAIPALDIYYNVWQAGVSLKYNIGSIYQAPRKTKAAEIIYEQAKQKETLTRQQVDVSVHTAYIRYHEAKDDLKTYTADLESAVENYRIVEKKYFNQLSLLTDMIDATNIKIEAELKVTNAQIEIIYAWYQILKVTGKI
ncbi:TolC family protein [Flavobacterium sp. LC2016-01]|uniref:TolC family protein n=1 Tax=Flavobacterium sp. LC2016-01 TaxID=2675876 RepID=UPI0012BA5D33|nr:TolC family protein [Flavobacterium sp. LC2016-01]MTH15848.1 hypothetical protein [Flavobacterium sp. LC2016-01]